MTAFPYSIPFPKAAHTRNSSASATVSEFLLSGWLNNWLNLILKFLLISSFLGCQLHHCTLTPPFPKTLGSETATLVLEFLFGVINLCFQKSKRGIWLNILFEQLNLIRTHQGREGICPKPTRKQSTGAISTSISRIVPHGSRIRVQPLNHRIG